MEILATTKVSLSRILAFSVLVFIALATISLGQQSTNAGNADKETKDGLDFFETKIRPVLIKECYECHSEQASAQGKLKGNLWLDSAIGTRTGGDSGPAVVPHKPDDSLLVSALKQDAFEMPPKGKLTAEVIDAFVKWIEMGAPDPRQSVPKSKTPVIDIEQGKKFWAFQPLKKQLPAKSNSGLQVHHPVDQFIVGKQIAMGLEPSPTAEARILIRRAWFDLLGVPPTPAEMQEWTKRLSIPVRNDSQIGNATNIGVNRESWSELIDGLLKRPEYGERWARHWMDIARFAESYGYEQDYDRPTAYHYRDFLIRAFNSDMPFDQFAQWQIAGDELAPDDPLAWMATGILGAGAFPTQLTEAEFESTRYDELDDMVSTTSLAFLGLSVGCARCHDHKFDPITSRDYYQYAANFTSAIRTEREFDLDPTANAEKRKQYESNLDAARGLLEKVEMGDTTDLFIGFLNNPSDPDKDSKSWSLLTGELTSTGGSQFQLLEDGSYLAVGNAPGNETLSFIAGLGHQTVRAARIEALSDPSLPNQGPGRAPNGNFALGNVELFQIAKGTAEPSRVQIASASATHQQNDSSLSITASLDADPISGWAVDGQIGKNQAAVFNLSAPIESHDGDQLKLILAFNHPNQQHAIGRLRISVTSDPNAVPEIGQSGPPQQIATAIRRLRENITENSSAAGLREKMPTEWGVAFAWYKPQSPKWKEQSNRIAELEKAGPGISLTRVLVTSEGLPHLSHHADDRGYPHFYPETHLLRRGDVHQKVEIVSAGFPKVFVPENTDLGRWQTAAGQNGKTSMRRAALAKWMTDTEQGAGNLVARVIVNRLWQHHLGRGIVSTPNDFGASGERPTHPELLDWLASTLVENGWHLSEIHRWIMTSDTYMQSNKLANDPRLAIDPENIQFWHYPPKRLEAEPIRDSMLNVSGLLDSTMYGPGTLDANMRRRSIYFFIKRSQLIPQMMLFDWPEHLVSIGQRASTTIAPQALMFINSPQGRTYAEAFAKRVQTAESNASIVQAYSLAFGRAPTDSELQLALDFLSQQASTRRQFGDADADFQALADLCQTIMSMNEFVYID